MQIVRGGKFSWVHDLLIICGKTFTIVQQFETPYNERKNLQENLHDWRLIRKSFPPQTICIIRYIQQLLYVCIHHHVTKAELHNTF